MVPPFFASLPILDEAHPVLISVALQAFRGLVSFDAKEQATYLRAAYGQCKLYRQQLRRNDGLWKHIIWGPDKIDPWPWATSECYLLHFRGTQRLIILGNGWVAAGMLRVVATMRKADEAVQQGLQSEMADLGMWAKEIIEAASKLVVSTKSSDTRSVGG